MKRILLIIGSVAFLILGYLVYTFLPQLPIATGYAAKKACSNYFISKHPISETQKLDLTIPPLNLVTLAMNQKSGSVTASLFGMGESKAKYQAGLGCRIIQGKDDYKITHNPTYNTYTTPSIDVIETQKLRTSFDLDKLVAAIDLAFDGPDSFEKKTLSMLVLHKGKLIYDKYYPGYNRKTKILGWSMTKSIANLLIGILVKNQALKLHQDSLFKEWEGDERSKVTLQHLLQMNSGLEWTEEYKGASDIVDGLYKKEDYVAFVKAKPLELPVGKQFEYSSGSTNLLSGLIRQEFDSHESYLNFPHQALFSKLGLDQPILEIDEAGNYILSSYMYATTLDWAKLGYLYSTYGKWDNEQIVDSSYIAKSIMPSEQESSYGYQIWLNSDHKLYKDAPEDLYRFSGYEGQYVNVIPSEDLIVVRLGLSKGPPFDMNTVLKQIIEAKKT